MKRRIGTGRTAHVFAWFPVLVCAGAQVSPAVSDEQQQESAHRRPNLIFILADDLGYGDLSCFGSTKIQTPHLDSLARSGMRWTRFYAASAVCTPTRASCLTGRYPLRFGITRHFRDGDEHLPAGTAVVRADRDRSVAPLNSYPLFPSGKGGAAHGNRKPYHGYLE